MKGLLLLFRIACTVALFAVALHMFHVDYFPVLSEVFTAIFITGATLNMIDVVMLANKEE